MQERFPATREPAGTRWNAGVGHPVTLRARPARNKTQDAFDFTDARPKGAVWRGKKR